MGSFTFSMNWPRAKCIVLVGEDGILFCFLIFSGVRSPEPCAPFSYHRNVDGRAPADQKGLQKHSGCPGPHATFSISKRVYFVTKYKGSNSEAP